MGAWEGGRTDGPSGGSLHTLFLPAWGAAQAVPQPRGPCGSGFPRGGRTGCGPSGSSHQALQERVSEQMHSPSRGHSCCLFAGDPVLLCSAPLARGLALIPWTSSMTRSCLLQALPGRRIPWGEQLLLSCGDLSSGNGLCVPVPSGLGVLGEFWEVSDVSRRQGGYLSPNRLDY